MDPRAYQRKKNPHNSLFDLTVMGILCLLGLVCLYPFLTVLAYAFSDSAKLPGHMVTFYPIGFDPGAFLSVATRPVIRHSILLTFLVTLIGTGISLLITTISAYVTSMDRLPGRTFFSYIVLIPLYFSAGMVPTFMVMNGLGLYNTYAALILPIAVSEFNYILMRGYFREFPEELEDAAA